MSELSIKKQLLQRIYFGNLFVYIFGMTIVLSMVTTLLGEEMQKIDEMEALFEKKYEAWKKYRKQQSPSPSSFRTIYMEGQPYLEMLKLGIPALPYMMKKIENDAYDGGRDLVWIVSKITNKKFHITRTGQKPGGFRWTVEEFPDMNDLTSPPSRYKLWLRWWKEGKKLTAQQFEKFYQQWKKLNRQGKETEAKAKYQRVIDLGVAALPYILDKVKQGDVELVPAISVLTDNKVKKDAKQSECLDWWESNKQKWLIPFPNIKADNTPTHKDQPGAEEPNEG